MKRGPSHLYVGAADRIVRRDGGAAVIGTPAIQHVEHSSICNRGIMSSNWYSPPGALAALALRARRLSTRSAHCARTSPGSQ